MMIPTPAVINFMSSSGIGMMRRISPAPAVLNPAFMAFTAIVIHF
jgi:hypothetical protein